MGLAAQVTRLDHVRQQVNLADTGKGIIERVEKTALDTLALQAQVAHGLKVQVLVTAVEGLVGHLEEGVVSIVEQALQALTQLQGGLVAHLQEQYRKARQRRTPASIDGCRQGHHLAFFLHPVLLAGCLARRG